MTPENDTPDASTEDSTAVAHESELLLQSARPTRSVSRAGSSARSRSGSTVSSVHTDNISERVHSPHPDNIKTPTRAWSTSWAPYTFSNLYLAISSLVAFGLCLTTFLLWWRSSTNYGLGPDGGSSVLLFGWRYSPTLIAVLYVQMTTVLFEDVKRTEPFARLSRPQGAKASTSILKAPGAWWNALYDGSAKKNGSRSWILFFAAILNIFGFMAISPLSSAFLISEDVVVPKTTAFTSLSPITDSNFRLDADRFAYFRTIAHLLQNVSTSPWITDEYTLLPFWPTDMPSAVTSLPVSSSQKWQAETAVFKTDLSCTEMSLESQSTGNTTHENNRFSRSFIWSSPDGCTYGVSASDDTFVMGGGSWSNTSTFYSAESILNPETAEHSAPSVTNSTAECQNKEVIFVYEPSKSAAESGPSGARYAAYLCDTNYYMAHVSTSITLDGVEPEFSFDETEFERKKVLIPNSFLNTTQFADLMLNPDWPTYMYSVFSSRKIGLGGPSILLGALYDYDVSSMVSGLKVNGLDLVQLAAKIKHRFFGEVLQSSLSQQGALQRAPINGHVYAIETRIVVQTGVAIALGVLLAVSFCLALVIWWLSRQQRRPLNLQANPMTTMGVAFLLTHNEHAISVFRRFRQPSHSDLREKLSREWFHTNSDGLVRASAVDNVHHDHDFSQSESGTPRLFRLPALIPLVMALIGLVVGIAVLFHYSVTTGLYEKAFVWQVQLSSINRGLSPVAPFAIIPTLFATGIGLWWGAIDDNFRRLQPFLAMSCNEPPPFSRGPGISYQSSFWLWACAKASLNKHWLLALVTLGSTLSPIFTTSMSALFELGPGIVSHPVTLNRTLEIRDTPLKVDVGFDLHDYLSTNWMYTSTIQLSMNGSQPSWSKNGWSFVPIEMNNIDLSNHLESNLQVNSSQLNISLTTPALRARVECSPPPAEGIANISNWLTPENISDPTVWNRSTIPHGIGEVYKLGKLSASIEDPGEEFSNLICPYTPSRNTTIEGHDQGWDEGCTSVIPNYYEIRCCKNESSNDWDPNAAVGYWTINKDLDSALHGNNFTAKWVRGSSVSEIKKIPLKGYLYAEEIYFAFPEPPSMMLMNCKPIIESATADISVNPRDGSIQTFRITDTPKQVPNAFSTGPSGTEEGCTDFEHNCYYAIEGVGILFMESTLAASSRYTSDGQYEDLSDNTFNIRDEVNGLNLDFMTYSMYEMAHEDPTALFNPDTFNALAQKTFSTFFQHFISNNNSLATGGGWGYQKLNTSLLKDQTVEAILSRRVEVLKMNSVAVWLSIGILCWLILTTIVVVLQRRYFGLVRNVESLGDVLVLIAGSTDLLQVVRDIQDGHLTKSEYEDRLTRLGWFIDGEGDLRWGIEMVKPYGTGSVKWVSEPRFSKEDGSKTWMLSHEETNVEST